MALFTPSVKKKDKSEEKKRYAGIVQVSYIALAGIVGGEN